MGHTSPQRNGPKQGTMRPLSSLCRGIDTSPKPQAENGSRRCRCRTSGWRLQLAGGNPAPAGCHGVARCQGRLNAAAFLALEGTAVVAGRSRFKFRQQHPILVATRTARPLDRGNIRRGYRLIFGHDPSLHSLGGVTDAPDRQRQPARVRMILPAMSAVVKIAHFEKLCR